MIGRGRLRPSLLPLMRSLREAIKRLCARRKLRRNAKRSLVKLRLIDARGGKSWRASGVTMKLETRGAQRLKDFFLAMTRTSFGQLGVGDQQIVDYVASILTEFSSSSRWLALRDAHGRRISSVVEMLVAQMGIPRTQGRVTGERELRKYVGDYTLFMSGLFRAFVERGGYLNYYMEEGKRSYQAVSKLDVALYRPGFLMFEELSRGFENYSGALDYMRKCFFAPAPNQDPFAGFLEQIDGWVRLRLADN
jgi:hypothetical protein